MFATVVWFSSFSLQACAAYSFITIPSLSNIFSRLNLYLLSGQVALANQCLSQGERSFCISFRSILSTFVVYLGSFAALLSFFFTVIFSPLADAFLKAAVSILPEVPRSISVEGKLRSSESFLLDFINNFLATLLVVPVTQFISSPYKQKDLPSSFCPAQTQQNSHIYVTCMCM